MKMFKDKIKFVDDIANVVVPIQDNVEKIEYKVYRKKSNSTTFAEFVVITYKGGSQTVRNSTSNSYSQILEDISKYLNHGYYDEQYLLDAIRNNNEWEEIK